MQNNILQIDIIGDAQNFLKEISKVENAAKEAAGKIKNMGDGVNSNKIISLAGDIDKVEGKAKSAKAKLDSIGDGVNGNKVISLGGDIDKVDGKAKGAKAKIDVLGASVDVSGVQTLSGDLDKAEGKARGTKEKVENLGATSETRGISGVNAILERSHSKAGEVLDTVVGLGTYVNTTGIDSLNKKVGVLDDKVVHADAVVNKQREFDIKVIAAETKLGNLRQMLKNVSDDADKTHEVKLSIKDAQRDLAGAKKEQSDFNKGNNMSMGSKISNKVTGFMDEHALALGAAGVAVAGVKMGYDFANNLGKYRTDVFEKTGYTMQAADFKQIGQISQATGRTTEELGTTYINALRNGQIKGDLSGQGDQKTLKQLASVEAMGLDPILFGQNVKALMASDPTQTKASAQDKLYGFLKGGGNNIQDVLGITSEYIPQLKQLGLSFEQGMSVITEANKRGVYSPEKTLDLLKETQMTFVDLFDQSKGGDVGPLNKLFGTEFADIKKARQEGKLSDADLGQILAKKLATLGKADQKQMVSQIFKSQGEDLGVENIIASYESLNVNSKKMAQEFTTNGNVALEQLNKIALTMPSTALGITALASSLNELSDAYTGADRVLKQQAGVINNETLAKENKQVNESLYSYGTVPLAAQTPTPINFGPNVIDNLDPMKNFLSGGKGTGTTIINNYNSESASLQVKLARLKEGKSAFA